MDSDSPEEPNKITCIICYLKISPDDPYAMIDNNHEIGKYHLSCLETWLTKSTNGLLSQDKIESYTIYHHNQKIDTCSVGIKNPENLIIIPNNINIPPDDSNSKPIYYIIFVVCTIILFLIIIYFFYS